MCTRTLDGKLRPHIDHIRSLASGSLYPGENLNRENNLQALCEECHVKRKTPQDRKEHAEIAQYERKRYGLEKPQKRRSRGIFVWKTADGSLRWTGWRKGVPPPSWIKRKDEP